MAQRKGDELGFFFAKTKESKLHGHLFINQTQGGFQLCWCKERRIRTLLSYPKNFSLVFPTANPNQSTAWCHLSQERDSLWTNPDVFNDVTTETIRSQNLHHADSLPLKKENKEMEKMQCVQDRGRGPSWSRPASLTGSKLE